MGGRRCLRGEGGEMPARRLYGIASDQELFLRVGGRKLPIKNILLKNIITFVVLLRLC